jgi:prevent-host-death family protein
MQISGCPKVSLRAHMPIIVDDVSAATILAELVDLVVAGEEIIIVRDGTPVVRLVPVIPPRKRLAGKYRGLGQVDDSFFHPLPADELAQWEGDSDG